MLKIREKIKRLFGSFRRLKFVVDAGAYVSSTFFLQAAGFLLTPLWARYLTPEDYGITGTLTAYGGVLSSMLMLGLNGSLVRHYYDHEEDINKQKSYITSVVLFQMLFSGVIVFLLMAFGPSLWVRFTSGKIPFDPYVRLMLTTACITNWIRFPQILYQAQQKVKNYVYIGYGKFILGVAGNIIFIVMLRKGAYGQMLGQLLAGSFVVITALLIMWSNWFSPRIKWDHIRSALIFGLPLVPHALSSWAIQAADRLILERYLTLDELGLYSLGFTLGMAMKLLVSGINRAWSPYYYRLMKNNPHPEKRIIQVVSIYIAFVGGICIFGILFAGEIVHVLFPQIYYGVIPYIAPVVLGYLMLGFYFFSTMPLFYFKKTKILPLITGSAAIINVVLNIWLIPKYGALGSAWITLGTYIYYFIFVYFTGRRYHDVKYPFGKYGIILMIILVSTSINLALGVFDVFSILIKLALLLLFIAVAYVLLIKPYFDKWIRKELLGQDLG